ncbi:hypothetical protein JOB18_021750 [Solea senegalensis]|uniref:Uncharacterized protein n=1 Tax=Solea senegalensis TaxID=28829 RepID=A0AAV6RIC4_SOLSE|nr:hypothetical protein JOB18_021750 [Solea senegalensis]
MKVHQRRPPLSRRTSSASNDKNFLDFSTTTASAQTLGSLQGALQGQIPEPAVAEAQGALVQPWRSIPVIFSLERRNIKKKIIHSLRAEDASSHSTGPDTNLYKDVCGSAVDCFSSKHRTHDLPQVFLVGPWRRHAGGFPGQLPLSCRRPGITCSS